MSERQPPNRRNRAVLCPICVQNVHHAQIKVRHPPSTLVAQMFLNNWLALYWASLTVHDVDVALEPIQFYLPSESQCEAAFRAGSTTPFHFGCTLDQQWARYDTKFTYGKWCIGEFVPRPTPVGFFGIVNRFGLADMHGQIMEWCADQWLADPLDGSSRDKSSAESAEKSMERLISEQRMRILRGGSWTASAVLCRAAYRNALPCSIDSASYGFRPCCHFPVRRTSASDRH